MLADRLEQTRASINRVQADLSIGSKKLEKSTSLTEALEPENLASGRLGKEFNLTAYRADQGLGWEPRMTILRRVVGVRERLAAFSIPRYQEQTVQLEQDAKALKDLETSQLGEIYKQLISDREFIETAIKNGHFQTKELVWIDSQFIGFGLEIPKPVEISPAAIEVFMKNKNTPAHIKEFARSSDMGTALQCTAESLKDETTDLAELRSRLIGFIFEQIAFKVARSSMVSNGKSPMVLLSPDDTFELFRSTNPDKKVISHSNGLQKGIEGVSIPDGVVIALYGNDKADFFNLVEYSMVNFKKAGSAAESKQQQVDYFQSYDNEVFKGLASWVDGYNKHQLNTPKLFDSHPTLAGRTFRVRTPKEGFTLFYLMAQGLKAPEGVDPKKVKEIKINPSHITNFANAIIATSQSQK